MGQPQPNLDPRERDIFLEALDRETLEAREAFLDAACRGDATLRRRIEVMLTDHFSSDSFMAAPAGGEAPRCSHQLIERPNDRIGRYKLLEKIGEGGCGVVYMAAQEEPVKRRVALKVIKLGMDTENVIARFEVERQALAMMDHPNIAKVYDGGATDTGRPYFVMELVRGVKITEYCDENNLATRERLELCVQVCHAVQHAHQKGIIHRDLKPSNILVTINDGVPVPKVIDFGIAKATAGQELTDKTIFTAFEQFLGTPAYVSPEQALLTSLDVDTRSDIYSLGVLLYELLTGRTPLETADLLKVGMDAMRRTIREKEPARPSTRLSTLAQNDLTTTATRRSTNPPQLIHDIRRDLDWIVMKCLEKDRTRRYETANALAADLQRHLRNEPVVARPPSPLYVTRKFVDRHRVGVSVAIAFCVGMVVATIVSTSLALWATREQARAERERVRAEAHLGTALDAVENYRMLAEHPYLKRPESASFRKELLQAGVPFLDDFARQEGGNLDLRLRRGVAYRSLAEIQSQLGQWSEAIANLRRATNVFQALASSNAMWAVPRRQWAESCALLGKLLRFTGQEPDAETVHREAIFLEEQLVKDFPGDPAHQSQLAARRADLAVFLLDSGRLHEGKENYDQARVGLRKCIAAHPESLDVRRELIRTVVRCESFLAWYEPATHERTNTLSETRLLSQLEDNPEKLTLEERFLLAHALSLLGEAQHQLGDARLADQSLHKALVLWEPLSNEFPHQSSYKVGLAAACERLGVALAATGRRDAEEAFQKSAEILDPGVRPLPFDPDSIEQLARTHCSMARFEQQKGRLSQARDHFFTARQQQELLVARFPTRARYRGPLARILDETAELLLKNGNTEAALAELSAAEGHYQKMIAAAPDDAYWRERVDETRARIERLSRQ